MRDHYLMLCQKRFIVSKRSSVLLGNSGARPFAKHSNRYTAAGDF